MPRNTNNIGGDTIVYRDSDEYIQCDSDAVISNVRDWR